MSMQTDRQQTRALCMSDPLGQLNRGPLFHFYVGTEPT